MKGCQDRSAAPKRAWRAFATLAVLLILPEVVEGHGGHDHGAAAVGTVGLEPVELDERTIAKLAITSRAAEKRKFATRLISYGQVIGDPAGEITVSARVAGRITEVRVREGALVKRDEELAVLRSDLPGDPPPSLVVVSTMDGIVRERWIEPGQGVEAGQELFLIQKPQAMLVECQVQEIDIGRLRVGMKALLEADAFPDHSSNGSILRMAGQLDTDHRLAVIIQPEGPEGMVEGLRPGMHVRAGIITATDANLAVPRQALLGRAGNYFVFVQEGRRFRGRPVAIGVSDEGEVEIKGGLTAGERVVTQGAWELQYAAAKVHPAPSEMRAPGAASQKGSPAPQAGDPTGADVRLDEAAQSHLGLKTTEAELLSLERLVRGYGEIETDPEHVARVGTNGAGVVRELAVFGGETVAAGAMLARVEPVLIGASPAPVAILAPLEGTVLDSAARIGRMFREKTDLFTLADLRFVRVRCRIYESESRALELGQVARISSEAWPGREFQGHVLSFGAQLEEATRTLPVWIALHQDELLLRPHMLVEVHIVTGPREEGLAVPLSAVLDENRGPFVYVKFGNAFRRQHVSLGARDARHVIISDGVFPGDPVVSRGAERLRHASSSPVAPPTQQKEN